MARKLSLPTPQQQEAIASFIRAGGTEHIAAEAAGVDRAVFRRWLRRGRKRRANPTLRQFVAAVREAAAQCRLAAEMAIHKGKPLDWLKCGPGRAAPDEPGWTAAAKAPPAHTDKSDTAAADEIHAVIVRVLRGLEPYPDIRAKLAEDLRD